MSVFRSFEVKSERKYSYFFSGGGDKGEFITMEGDTYLPQTVVRQQF